MTDQIAVTFVLFSVIGFALLSITLASPVLGLTLTAVGFILSGSMFLAVAKGGIHEATGGIFFLGAIVSGGIAGLAREAKRMRRIDKTP